MKKSGFSQVLPFLILIAGIAGMALQYILFTGAVDERGLLDPSHWADTASWILAALVIVCLAARIAGLNGSLPYEKLFPRSLVAAAGNLIGAVGICQASVELLSAIGQKLNLITAAAGLMAAAVLLAAGLCRVKGVRLPVFLRFFPIIFFMLHLVCRYRQWSSSTQLQEYAFALFASVFLMLTCYQRGALETGAAGRKRYTFFGLSAAFFCLVSGWRHGLFYAAAGIWMLTDHCSLQPVAKSGPKYLHNHQGE